MTITLVKNCDKKHIECTRVSHRFLFVQVRCHYTVEGKTPDSCSCWCRGLRCARGWFARGSRWSPTHTRIATDRTEGNPETPGFHYPHPELCVHSRPLKKHIHKTSITRRGSAALMTWPFLAKQMWHYYNTVTGRYTETSYGSCTDTDDFWSSFPQYMMYCIVRNSIILLNTFWWCHGNVIK